MNSAGHPVNPSTVMPAPSPSRRGWFGTWLAVGILASAGSFIAGPLFVLVVLAAPLCVGPRRAARRLEVIGAITGVGVFCIGVGAARVADNRWAWMLWGVAVTASSLGVYVALRRLAALRSS